MCFCVLKKQLLYHPHVQVCLWILPPSPLDNNPVLVQTNFGVIMLLSPSLWKTFECFLFPPQPSNFSSQTGKMAAPRRGSPWNTAEHGWNSGSSQPEANRGMCWVQSHRDTSSSCRPLGWYFCSLTEISRHLTDKTSKTFHFESNFHSLLLENTN